MPLWVDTIQSPTARECGVPNAASDDLPSGSTATEPQKVLGLGPSKTTQQRLRPYRP